MKIKNYLYFPICHGQRSWQKKILKIQINEKQKTNKNNTVLECFPTTQNFPSATLPTLGTEPQTEIKVNAKTMRCQKLPIITAFLTCQKFGEEDKLFLMAMVLFFRTLEQSFTKNRQCASQSPNLNLIYSSTDCESFSIKQLLHENQTYTTNTTVVCKDMKTVHKNRLYFLTSDFCDFSSCGDGSLSATMGSLRPLIFFMLASQIRLYRAASSDSGLLISCGCAGGSLLE